MYTSVFHVDKLVSVSETAPRIGHIFSLDLIIHDAQNEEMYTILHPIATQTPLTRASYTVPANHNVSLISITLSVNWAHCSH